MKERLFFEIVILAGVIEVEDDKVLAAPPEMQALIGHSIKELEQSVARRRHTIKFTKIEDGEINES